MNAKMESVYQRTGFVINRLIAQMDLMKKLVVSEIKLSLNHELVKKLMITNHFDHHKMNDKIIFVVRGCAVT